MTDASDEVQRWMAMRGVAVVLSIVEAETSAAEAARIHGLTIAEIGRWKEQRFAAGDYCSEDGWGRLVAISSLKDERVWQQDSVGFVEARVAISQWIRWYDKDRPHEALRHLSPHQYRSQQLQAVV